MPATPDQPQGFGTPSGDQPGFAPPPSSPARPAPSNPPWEQGTTQPHPFQPTAAQHHWPAPDARLVVAPPPSGRGPRRTRGGRVRLLAALLAAALVLAALLSALPLLPGATPIQPISSTTPAAVDTVTPSASPGTASTATSGEGLGTPVDFVSGSGKGTITVLSAVWTDVGEMAPRPGDRYLVLDLAVRCTDGVLPVDALMFLATTRVDRELPGFGPQLTNPFRGQVLEAGATARGQVGFALSPGAVTVQVLDADLKVVADIRIPAP